MTDVQRQVPFADGGMARRRTDVPAAAAGDGDLASRRPRVVIADDHAILLDALAVLLAPAVSVVGTATSGEALLALVDETHPDLVITDLSMPGLSGFEVVRALRQRPGSPPVLMLTVHADIGTLRTALALGAAGYLVKNAAVTDLLDAVITILRGERYLPPALRQAVDDAPLTKIEQLSPRQRAVLEALAHGRSAKQIATTLGISERTVAFHKEQLRKRLGVYAPVEMVELLRRAGAWPGEAGASG